MQADERLWLTLQVPPYHGSTALLSSPAATSICRALSWQCEPKKIPGSMLGAGLRAHRYDSTTASWKASVTAALEAYEQARPAATGGSSFHHRMQRVFNQHADAYSFFWNLSRAVLFTKWAPMGKGPMGVDGLWHAGEGGSGGSGGGGSGGGDSGGNSSHQHWAFELDERAVPPSVAAAGIRRLRWGVLMGYRPYCLWPLSSHDAENRLAFLNATGGGGGYEGGASRDDDDASGLTIAAAACPVSVWTLRLLDEVRSLEAFVSEHRMHVASHRPVLVLSFADLLWRPAEAVRSLLGFAPCLRSLNLSYVPRRGVDVFAENLFKVRGSIATFGARFERRAAFVLPLPRARRHMRGGRGPREGAGCGAAVHRIVPGVGRVVSEKRRRRRQRQQQSGELSRRHDRASLATWRAVARRGGDRGGRGPRRRSRTSSSTCGVSRRVQ